ncbi:DUF4913 domain-containing protein [Arthrobacter sp. K5]|uniref:DUF4913 domain-containing protein n=1 Tax=Arthrobacter sp. K5 TaxID=2839623 RepID=A0AAU8EK09_9MICC
MRRRAGRRSPADRPEHLGERGRKRRGCSRAVLSNVAEFISKKRANTLPPPAQRARRCDLVPAVVKARRSDQPLEALWRAWEFLRLEGTAGMSVWWSDHADHHMSVLLSTDGPFKGCTTDDGHGPNLPLYPAKNRP